MARMGSKPPTTTKCSCENPDWSIWELDISTSGDLVITLDCRNCKSLWKTKSRSARKYADLNRKIHSGSPTTYGEYFRKADEERKKILNRKIDRQKEIIADAEKEIKKAQKELDSLEDAPIVPE